MTSVTRFPVAVALRPLEKGCTPALVAVRIAEQANVDS